MDNKKAVSDIRELCEELFNCGKNLSNRNMVGGSPAVRRASPERRKEDIKEEIVSRFEKLEKKIQEIESQCGALRHAYEYDFTSEEEE